MDPFFLILLFIASFGIGIIGALAGVGGGVLFTPLMMAFTDLNIDIIRSTGLALAMMGSAFVVRQFIGAGATRVNFILFVSLALTVGSILGAFVGLSLVKEYGKVGEAYVRLSLGVLIIIVATIMLTYKEGGGRIRGGEARGLAKALGLYGVFYDPSIKEEIKYTARNLPLSFVLFSGVGFISGMFGVGGGWALVPVLNIVMGLPIKIAVATSKTSFIVGDMPGFWVYVHEGAVENLLLAAVLPGVALGSIVGARLMLVTKARVIKMAVVAVMLISAVQLINRALSVLL